jgi:hypothetical protein
MAGSRYYFRLQSNFHEAVVFMYSQMAMILCGDGVLK